MVFWVHIDATEFWEESDDDIDADFGADDAPPMPIEPTQQKDNPDAVVWWITLFLCIFRSVHFLPDKAVAWLLLFLGALLRFLGQYSPVIANIALALPTSVYLLQKYMGTPEMLTNMKKYIVCPSCHALYTYKDCLEVNGRSAASKRCNRVYYASAQPCGATLLKTVITPSGKSQLYPRRVFCSLDFAFSLKSLLLKNGVMEICERARQQCSKRGVLSDVYDGALWQEFMQYNGENFLRAPYNYAVLLNCDWFQPFLHIKYSVGVIYLVLLNLPRHLRYKRENLIIVGIIPGPSEPSLNINSYLSPLVSSLKDMWDGIFVSLPRSGEVKIRCVLLGVCCDLPAGRKVCGFMGHNANKACTRCYSSFSEGFGKSNFSNFNKDSWPSRTVSSHRRKVRKIMQSRSKSEASEMESELGCRYSVLLELFYFDPVRMLLIDPMHNLFLGTAKRMTQSIWIGNNILTSNHLKVIHRRLSSVAVPSDLGRLPLHIESGSTFTAQQWKNWTLYFSTMCLFDLLPREHFRCWQSFVLACRRFCQSSISVEDITVADALLLKFCRKCVEMYGPSSITPNMHLHCHLAECIRDFGPSQAFWLFPFERYNGLLGRQPHNNRCIELQLMRRFLTDNFHLQMSCGSLCNPLADSFHSVIFSPDQFRIDDHLAEDNQDEIVLARKSSIGYLSSEEISSLKLLYCRKYPELNSVLTSGALEIPSCFRKFSHGFVKKRKISSRSENSKQPYVAAIPTLPFSNYEAHGFTTTSPRAAEVLYFGRQHLTHPETGSMSTCSFASVRWPKPCSSPVVGKPVELWYNDWFDYQLENDFIALPSITSRMVTLCENIESQNILITVPLLE